MSTSDAASLRLAHLRAAVERDPSDFIAWVELSDSELDAGDAEAGESAAARAL